jgi:hypothetical protein
MKKNAVAYSKVKLPRTNAISPPLGKRGRYGEVRREGRPVLERRSPIREPEIQDPDSRALRRRRESEKVTHAEKREGRKRQSEKARGEERGKISAVRSIVAIFKAGRLEFTSCLSKRPFPRHVITAHDPGRDFRLSFSGSRARYAGI